MHRSNVGRRSSTSALVIDYPWTKMKEDVAAFYTVEESKGLSEERVKRDLERFGPNGKIDQQNERKICFVKFCSLSLRRTSC